MDIRRIAVVGAVGNMGREIVKGVLNTEGFQLAAAIDVRNTGEDAGELAGTGRCGVPISNSLKEILENTKIDAAIDFTSPKYVMDNIRVCLTAGVPMVVGTTGITGENLEDIKVLSKRTGVSIIVAPNFTIGAILMMMFAKTASKYFSNVEIIELHHNKKIDAPSGTAMKTAEMIIEDREGFPSPPQGEFEKLSGSRGGELDGIRIHSVRLPGFIAHQEVIFGDSGQILTIRHDSMTRECYVPGVLMAVRKLSEVNGLVYGLENLI